MAKKVIWSSKAQKERREILEYWFRCNGNKRYSRKLGSEFTHAAKIISDFNHIGKKQSGKKFVIIYPTSINSFTRSQMCLLKS
ncbi:MAG: hypothetical protein JST55_06665 [Bacteroidetes bacterium]|nr:hypothetical protein [Bacteroidota bacterium]